MNKHFLFSSVLAAFLAASTHSLAASDGFKGLLDNNATASESSEATQSAIPTEKVATKRLPDPLVTEKRKDNFGMEWSVWADYGMRLKKTGDDDYLNTSQYIDKTNGSSFGLGVQMFRYFGIRGWVGDADSEYKYKSGVPLAMANRTYFHGRKKFGTAFGFDALGFLPLGGSLSLYAGPGLEVCEEADFFVTEPADGYQVRLDNRKYMPYLTGSGGLNFRPIAQFVGNSAPFSGLTINAGYHTARGITLGLGLGW